MVGLSDCQIVGLSEYQKTVIVFVSGLSIFMLDEWYSIILQVLLSPSYIRSNLQSNSAN
jgi:hypothetical protein